MQAIGTVRSEPTTKEASRYLGEAKIKSTRYWQPLSSRPSLVMHYIIDGAATKRPPSRRRWTN